MLPLKSVPLYWKAIGDERFQMKSVLNFAGAYIYEDQQTSTRYTLVGVQGFDKMLRSYIILACVIITSMSSVALGPAKIFITQGIWITPLGIQFPFADVSDIAFYMDLTIQMIVAIIGILTTVSIEYVQVIINNAVELSADVIVLNCDILSEQLEDTQRLKPKSAAMLRNICIQIQDFNQLVFLFCFLVFQMDFEAEFLYVFVVVFSDTLKASKRYSTIDRCMDQGL